MLLGSEKSGYDRQIAKIEKNVRIGCKNDGSAFIAVAVFTITGEIVKWLLFDQLAIELEEQLSGQ